MAMASLLLLLMVSAVQEVVAAAGCDSSSQCEDQGVGL